MSKTNTPIKALLGAFALLLASAGVAAPSTDDANAKPDVAAVAQSAVVPSIEILESQSNLAGTCGGPPAATSGFDINTAVNVTAQTSAKVVVTGLLKTPITLNAFTDETGFNLKGAFQGNYPNFHIQPFGGGLPPHTPIQIKISTYTSPNLAGTITFTSTVHFDCTTGHVLKIAADPPPPSSAVPSISDIGLLLLSALLALFGLRTLRRQVRS